VIEEVPRATVEIADGVTAVVGTTAVVTNAVAAATTAGEETIPIAGVGTVGMAETAVAAGGDGEGVGMEGAGTAADLDLRIPRGATRTMKRFEPRLLTTLTFAV